MSYIAYIIYVFRLFDAWEISLNICLGDWWGRDQYNVCMYVLLHAWLVATVPVYIIDFNV